MGCLPYPTAHQAELVSDRVTMPILVQSLAFAAPVYRP